MKLWTTPAEQADLLVEHLERERRRIARRGRTRRAWHWWMRQWWAK